MDAARPQPSKSNRSEKGRAAYEKRARTRGRNVIVRWLPSTTMTWENFEEVPLPRFSLGKISIFPRDFQHGDTDAPVVFLLRVRRRLGRVHSSPRIARPLVRRTRGRDAANTIAGIRPRPATRSFQRRVTEIILRI